VQKEFEFQGLDSRELSLSLSNPDFTSAVAMAEAINKEFSTARQLGLVAEAINAATVNLHYNIVARDSVKKYVPFIEFISKVENVTFSIETAAKVIVNERTGTIVAGGNVKISEIAVTHGGIRVEVVNLPEVVQPQPFSTGQTEIIPNPEAVVEETDAQMVVLPSTATVTDLAQALNSLGVTPRDVISIFQAIKEAGALHGQLVIM
jgi:flagellar P-ring protein precursor FlgI